MKTQHFANSFGTGFFLALLVFVSLETPDAQAKKKVAAPWVGKTAEGKPCSGGQPTSGPFDYLQRRVLPGELAVVEDFHFNSDVENLRKGMTTEPMGDIDYTLRVFPNHHRALVSAMNFRLQHKKWPEKSKGHRVECYLQRAINYSPKDPIPYSMLGYALHKLGKPERSLKPYATASKMIPGDMTIKYNMGLALTDVKKYRQAQKIAVEVYAADYPLPALKRRLIAAGTWKENKKGKVTENIAARDDSKNDTSISPKTSNELDSANASGKEKLAGLRAIEDTETQRKSTATDASEKADEKALRNREIFAAAIAARLAEEAALANTVKQAEAIEFDQENAAETGDKKADKKAVKNDEIFAAAIVASQVKQNGATTVSDATKAADKKTLIGETISAATAAMGQTKEEDSANTEITSSLQSIEKSEANVTAADTTKKKSRTSSEILAAAIAAQQAGESGTTPPVKMTGQRSALTKKEKFAAALSAAADEPVLNEELAAKRRDKFAAKLAAKGLLKDENIVTAPKTDTD